MSVGIMAAAVHITGGTVVADNTYTYEEGVDGAAVTVANGVDQIVGTPTFEADAAAHGSLGIRLSGISQAVRYVVAADHSGSVYLSPAGVPGTTSNLVMTWGTSANSTNYQIRFHSNGSIQISDVSNALVGAQSTTTWAVGDWFRFDWQADESAGFTTQLSLRIFKNANVAGGTPDETMVRTAPTYAGSTTRLRLRTATAGYTFHFDTLRLDDTLQWLGPA